MKKAISKEIKETIRVTFTFDELVDILVCSGHLQSSNEPYAASTDEYEDTITFELRTSTWINA